VASHDREWQKPCSFSPEQYQKFYDTLMGGGYDSAAEGEDAGAEDDAATDAMSESDLDDDAADADEDVVDEEGAVVEEPEEEADEPPPQKVKKSSAKKVVASSGYQKQQTLISQTNFAELTADAAAGQVQQRRKAVTRFSFLEVQGDATAADLVAFEQEIYRAACTQADRLKVVKHWDNTLFADIYVNIQRGLLANLHTASPIKNGRLLTRLRDGELKLTELPAMSSYELYPENWKELADRQMLREQKLLEGNKGAATDRFKCNRCGKRECSYYEMQTRSADEPMTIFISCLNCGKRWRQ
jgi:DNA-directed RNA polymerase subunit M/transcription elongation factor TFIIS